MYGCPVESPNPFELICELVSSEVPGITGDISGSAEILIDESVSTYTKSQVSTLLDDPNYKDSDELMQILDSRQAIRLSALKWLEPFNVASDLATIAEATCQAANGNWQGAGLTIIRLNAELVLSRTPQGAALVIVFSVAERAGLIEYFEDAARATAHNIQTVINPYNYLRSLLDQVPGASCLQDNSYQCIPNIPLYNR
jgi:hypothetical protein